MTIIARWRSAITGRFVTAAYAIRNAATTLLQRMRRQ